MFRVAAGVHGRLGSSGRRGFTLAQSVKTAREADSIPQRMEEWEKEENRRMRVGGERERELGPVHMKASCPVKCPQFPFPFLLRLLPRLSTNEASIRRKLFQMDGDDPRYRIPAVWDKWLISCPCAAAAPLHKSTLL